MHKLKRGEHSFFGESIKKKGISPNEKRKKSFIIQSHTLEKEKIEREIKIDKKKQLENKKQELEEEKKTIIKNALKGSYSVEIANETILKRHIKHREPDRRTLRKYRYGAIYRTTPRSTQ